MAQLPNTILFLGKTGSGKGTQAALIARELDYEMVSTGGRLREIGSRDTYLGRRVKEHYDSGMLFPYWFPTYLFQRALFSKEENEGIVFEGLGRKQEEAALFHEVAEWLRRSYIAFNLDISDDEAIQRQQNRGRDTLDTLEKIQIRLDEYRTHTVPAIDFFREKGKLIEIDGSQSIEEVHKAVMKHLT